VKSHAPLIRLVLYFLLGLWSLLLFIFCIIRLAYTLTPRTEKSLMGGLPFYDPSVVELLVCSVLGLGFSIFMFTTIRFRKEADYTSRNWFELGFLFVLWMLWLSGGAAATMVWPDLSWCVKFAPCRILQALMGWAWLGWLCITALYLPTLWIVAATQNWDENFFDTWGFTIPSLPSPNISGGIRHFPEAGTRNRLPSVPIRSASEEYRENSLEIKVEREILVEGGHRNFEREASKIRARLNSWMGHRRRSIEGQAPGWMDVERGVELDKKQEPDGLPSLPKMEN